MNKLIWNYLLLFAFILCKIPDVCASEGVNLSEVAVFAKSKMLSPALAISYIKAGSSTKEEFNKLKEYINSGKLSKEDLKLEKLEAKGGSVFLKVPNNGRGDCGFYSLGVTRERGVQKLLDNASSEHVRNALLEGESSLFPRAAEGEDEAEHFKNLVRRVIANTGSGEKYLLEITGNVVANQEDGTKETIYHDSVIVPGSMAALARALKKKLIVYTPCNYNKLRRFYVDNSGGSSNFEEAYVLISAGGGHYTKLKKIN